MPEAALSAPKTRLEFIDLLRGWAVIVMIETHVTNALLAVPFRETSWFAYLDFTNGLVAPSFLFCAGCGLWIALGRKWDDYLALRKPLWVYLRRLGWILGVAYALHLPNFSLHQIMTHLTAADAENLFQVDILHVIVTTLVFVVALAIIIRNRQAVLWTAITLALVLILVAPTAWSFAQTQSVPLILRNLLTEMPTSYFPLVPWSAFVFIGMAVTQVYMGAADKRRFFTRLFALGLFLAVAGTMFREFYNPWPWQLWRSTPIFFAMRIGIIFMVFAGMWKYTEWHKGTPLAQKGIVLVFGRDSLLIYVTHLIIVYGSVVNHGIASSIAQTFPPLTTFAIGAALIGLMYVEALVWVWMKAHLPRVSKLIPYAWAVLFLGFLLSNP